MDNKIVGNIFLKHQLGDVESIEKVEIGFTNKIYLINDKFILKVCDDKGNENNFEREVFFYELFKTKLPVPKIKIFDKSKKIYGKFFMIYPKIEGDNLYSKWHLINDKERKGIVKQLCNLLRVINKTKYDRFVKKFKIKLSNDWHGKTLSKLRNSLKKVSRKKLLSQKFIEVIKNFIDDNHHILKEQKMALVYWDVHFDNILVQGNKVVGILDFERTEIASMDFALDIVKRMADYPKKYMSEKSEKFARKKDYAKLLDWFKEFYPELFKFNDLDRRLGLYSVGHDLDTLIWYPKSKEVRQMIAKTVNYKGPLFSK